jgi:hypothetical protein
MLPLLSSAPENRSEGFRVAGSLFPASGVTLLQLAGRLVSADVHFGPAPALQSATSSRRDPQAARLPHMQQQPVDCYHYINNIYRAAIAPALVPCARWRDHDDKMARVIALPGENRAVPRSRAVAILSALEVDWPGRLVRWLRTSDRREQGTQRWRRWRYLAASARHLSLPLPGARLLARPVQWSGRARPNRTGNREPCQSARPAVLRVVLNIRSYRPGRYKT